MGAAHPVIEPNVNQVQWKKTHCTNKHKPVGSIIRNGFPKMQPSHNKLKLEAQGG
jgi:hypothetical protein